MKSCKTCAKGALAVLALLLTPALLFFAVPFGYGIARDLLVRPWLAPAALAVALAIALNAARRGRIASAA